MPPLRCQPWKRWLGKSLLPPGRGSRTTCSMSGEEAAKAPVTAGSNGPRAAMRRRIPAIPEPISKRRSGMSSCGIRSPARWSSSPSCRDPSLEPTSEPPTPPVATCRETIRRRPQSAVLTKESPDQRYTFSNSSMRLAIRSSRSSGQPTVRRFTSNHSAAARGRSELLLRAAHCPVHLVPMR